MLRRLLTPALVGGAVLGLLSALPVIAWGNLCCCLWILLGGALAAYQLQQRQSASLTAIDGALVGAAAGVIGAFVYLLINIPVTLLTTSIIDGLRERLTDAGVVIPPELAGVQGGAANGLMIAGSFVVMLFIAPIFAALGGLIGAMAFRTPPPPPPPTASATPPDSLPPPGPTHIP